jgi:hypothetical protein
MYLFSDPLDPLHRYIDSWTPESGVTSYGGYVNEHFQDEAINCSIKWAQGHPTAGIYAKRDILLNEELFTEYGKPQWIYTLKFFTHTPSPCTIQDATIRYNILPTDQLSPCLANLTSTPTRQDGRVVKAPNFHCRERNKYTPDKRGFDILSLKEVHRLGGWC